MRNLFFILLSIVTIISACYAEPEVANVNRSALEVLERSTNSLVTIQTITNGDLKNSLKIQLPLTESEKLIFNELVSSNKVVPGGIMLDISSSWGAPTTIGEIAKYLLACDRGRCPLSTKRFLEIPGANK